MSADLLTPLTTRKVGVDMNLAGAWRTLGTFNLDECDIDAVLDAAETLVRNQAVGAKNGKLRVTDASLDFKPVLMYWTEAKSWDVARHAR
jgi:hypothetical protein